MARVIYAIFGLAPQAPLDRTADAGYLLARTKAGARHLQHRFEQIAARIGRGGVFA